MEKEKRKVLKGWELFMLILIGIILLTFVLNNLGIKVINTTDDTEMIHHTRD